MDSYFIFINKPVGQTSQQCLSHFKRRFRIAKIGHHGTLDPFASGLLLAGVHEATKFFRFIDDRKKTYEATLLFGQQTDTLDLTGRVVAEREVPSWSRAQIDAALHSLRGKIRQRPPMYSAIKIGGEKLYELARKGLEVERDEREIEVFALECLEWNPPYLSFRAEVSRGTYIRVLAEQIAAQLDNVAHLTRLVRTELCGVSLERGFAIESSEVVPEHVKIPAEALLSHLGRLELSKEQLRELVCGRSVSLEQERLSAIPCPESIPLFYEGHFLGVGELDAGCLKALRLWNTSLPQFRV